MLLCGAGNLPHEIETAVPVEHKEMHGSPSGVFDVTCSVLLTFYLETEKQVSLAALGMMILRFYTFWRIDVSQCQENYSLAHSLTH